MNDPLLWKIIYQPLVWWIFQISEVYVWNPHQHNTLSLPFSSKICLQITTILNEQHENISSNSMWHIWNIWSIYCQMRDCFWPGFDIKTWSLFHTLRSAYSLYYYITGWTKNWWEKPENIRLDLPVFTTRNTSSSPIAFTFGNGTSHLPCKKTKDL